MATISTSVLNRIRAQIGKATETDVDDDGTIATVYRDENMGNGDILLTSWWIWKRRLADLQTRSFDTTTGGGLMNRSQRIRHIKAEINSLEAIIGHDNLPGNAAAQDTVISTYQIENLTSTELA